ncbi:hypothetical protein C4A13_04269 [Escherichia marmotae]|uniref:Uncharacterized protein n=1 Tax=Escherichia marmotae TaxID=1499973 RepID=A0A370V510_9ESCH|nr:hypothetical protein C4A13_04269 [Escherichia marmotae]
MHQRFTDTVCQAEVQTGVVSPVFAPAVIDTGGQQRERRPGDAGSDGVRIFLAFRLTEQRHFIPVILLVNQLTAQLRVRRQPAFGTDIPAVSRTFVIIGNGRGLPPVRQAFVPVGGQLQVITPGFHASPVAAVGVAPVHVIKHVVPQHPAVIREVTVAKSGIGGESPVVIPHPELGEQHVLRGVVKRQQHIERRAFQGEITVHTQLRFRRTELVQPLRDRICRLPGSRPGQQLAGSITAVAALQHTSGLHRRLCHRLLISLKDTGKCRGNLKKELQSGQPINCDTSYL